MLKLQWSYSELKLWSNQWLWLVSAVKIWGQTKMFCCYRMLYDPICSSTVYSSWLGQNISNIFIFPLYSVHVLRSDERSQSKVLQVCLFFAKMPIKFFFFVKLENIFCHFLVKIILEPYLDLYESYEENNNVHECFTSFLSS